VAEYRLYQLNDAGKIASAAEKITAVDDQEALVAAKSLKKAGLCEIWQGRRYVGRIGAAPADQPA
jgi:hypothetical protein